jgi:ribosomal protein L7/L12
MGQLNPRKAFEQALAFNRQASEELDENEKKLIQEGDLLEAMKAYRARTGVSLGEAKEVCEKAFKEQGKDLQLEKKIRDLKQLKEALESLGLKLSLAKSEAKEIRKDIKELKIEQETVTKNIMDVSYKIEDLMDTVSSYRLQIQTLISRLG